MVRMRGWFARVLRSAVLLRRSEPYRRRWPRTLSTSPDSGFVQVFTAQTRDATSVTVLRGLVLQRIGADATRSTITTPEQLAQVLGDLFALDLGAFAATTRTRLWERLRRAHEAWEAGGRG